MLANGGAQAQFVRYAKRFYEVRNPAGALILIAGVCVWSLARKPELWIMLGKPYLQNLRESVLLSREALRLPAMTFPGLICEVRKDDKPALSFAKHCGFREITASSLRKNGEDFIQLEVAA